MHICGQHHWSFASELLRGGGSKAIGSFQSLVANIFILHRLSLSTQQKILSCLMCPILCGHLAAIKHYKSPIASLIYERPLVGSFKVYHALLGLISFTRYVDDTKPKVQLDVCCLSRSGLFFGAV